MCTVIRMSNMFQKKKLSLHIKKWGKLEKRNKMNKEIEEEIKKKRKE